MLRAIQPWGAVMRSASPIAVLTLAAALLAPSGSTRAAALDAAGAKAFVESIYARYHGPDAEAFVPLSDTTASTLFEPSTAKLILQGSKVNEEEEVGPLDFDPICTCQDPDGIRADVTAQMTGPATATATAIVYFPQQPQSTRREVRFDLVGANGVWRVHDLHEQDLPSLRALMADAAKGAK
jgi:hypothetical protein